LTHDVSVLQACCIVNHTQRSLHQISNDLEAEGVRLSIIWAETDVIRLQAQIFGQMIQTELFCRRRWRSHLFLTKGLNSRQQEQQKQEI